MSVAGSASSQGTHSRSPSRSRSPPYNDGRYPPSNSSRYRYDYNYRPPRSGIAADLDNYRDLRDRERDRERDRSMLMREDRYLSSRGRERERDDRYPPYYRDDAHHYPPSMTSRDYSKGPINPIRREVSSDPSKDPKVTMSTSSSSIKDLKDDGKMPSTTTSSEPPPISSSSYASSSRYSDWRERERERDRERDRRYRDDDRRREYDRRRDGYMRYESSGYGAPPLLSTYQMPPYGGDSYRPDRDRDRDMPTSPSSYIPYYERDRLDDRDYYRGSRSSGSGGPLSDYDRYRGMGRSGSNRPNWGPSKLEDSRRMLDRDRPERITSTNPELRSGKTSPTPATYPIKDRNSDNTTVKYDSKKSDTESAVLQRPEESTTSAEKPTLSKASTDGISTDKPETETLEKGEVVDEEPQPKTGQLEKTKEDDKEKLVEEKEEKEQKEEEGEQKSITLVDSDIKQTESPEPMEVNYSKEEKTKDEPSIVDITEVKTEEIAANSEQTLLSSLSVQSEEKAEVAAQPQPQPPPTITTEPPPSSDTRSKDDTSINLTQEQIVERIDNIENQISTYEELLEVALKREEEEANTTVRDEEDVEMVDDEDENAEERAAKNKEEAKKQALQAMENEPSASTTSTDIIDFTDTSSPIMRKRPQLLINQLRAKNDHLDDELYEKILLENQKLAKQNSATLSRNWQGTKENLDDWSDEEKWTKPLYSNIEDYPCYKENLVQFEQLRISVAHTLGTQKVALKKKERFLKNEYKALYEQWKEKNLALDRMRNHERKAAERYGSHRSRRRDEHEEYVDNVIFVSNAPDALRFKSDGTSTPYGGNGYFTSDAARSEAELLEIIQSLEAAEMRNPESRSKKTTATIPPMILDVRERMRVYDDRSGLVKDPLTYYHTGSDTGDAWNQQEVTTFMESYMMYPKQFERIANAVGTKTACQCVLFYYRKKKKIDFKALMKKGRRGRATKHRDRIAAAIRAVTGDAPPNARKTKSKGSALMTDIGEAQVSRKAKEKDAERKSRELRDLEQANAYWDSVAERKKSRRPTFSSANSNVSVPPITTPLVQSAPVSRASDDIEMMLQQQQPVQQEKRRTNSGSSTGQGRRKGRASREASHAPTPYTEASPVLANNEPLTSKRYSDDLMDTIDETDDKNAISSSASVSSGGGGGATKWSDREKELVIEAFKQYGRDFTQASNIVKSKTEEQCRNFYHNFKRKYGPNVFNEETNRQPETSTQTAVSTATNATLLPTASDMPRVPSPATIQTAVHNEVVALGGRTDLKAEEEDAAAALVGMFQMGANTPRDEAPKQPVVASQARTSTSHGNDIASSPTTNAFIAATPASAGPSSPLQQAAYSAPASNPTQQRRRRVRSSSSRIESAKIETASSDWNDAEYGARSGGRKLGRTSTLTETKRPSYSSYWSVLERNDFINYLGAYGTDWEKVANAMGSKTAIQVRNFYVNNEEKLHLRDIVEQFRIRQQQTKRDIPRMGSSFDSNSAHFQTLQSFPFPTSVVEQSPSIVQPIAKSSPPQPQQPQPPVSSAPYYGPISGFYSSTPPPPPSRITQSASETVYSGTNNITAYPSSTANVQTSTSIPARPITHQQLPEAPSAVTKVADLLNNDDPAEPTQNSWETWFGS
ncbi:MAG: hypothetical protein EXX96DRAFT_574994 [Benjaminiella poitrasii]|nr:MAG: hypothetical protein EXX96DRAFT_574994 [Benjaminiella poitrasii]